MKSKLLQKDYSEELEELCESKRFEKEAQNLLLSMLYKVDGAYNDYKTVKREVPSKEEFLQIIIDIVRNYCREIEIARPNSELEKELAKSRCKIVEEEPDNKYNKEQKVIFFPNEKVVLYSIIKAGMEKINTNLKLKDKAILASVQIGMCISASEVIRDFNGFSWSQIVSEIESIECNTIYTDLIYLLGEKYVNNLNSNNIHIIGSDHLHLTNNVPETSCDITAAGIILNKGTTKGDIYINADNLTTTVNLYKLADATDTNQFITLDSNSIKINNSSGSINLPRSLGDFTIEGIRAIKGIAPEISLTAGSNILKVHETNGISLSANKIITKSDDTQITNSVGNYGLKVEESSNTLISSINNIIASQINIRTGDENTYTEKLTINETTSTITNRNINISANEDFTITAPVNFKLTASHVNIKSSNNTADSGIITQNLKVNAVANFGGFAIYWDDDTNSLIFTEGELNWI